MLIYMGNLNTCFLMKKAKIPQMSFPFDSDTECMQNSQMTWNWRFHSWHFVWVKWLMMVSLTGGGVLQSIRGWTEGDVLELLCTSLGLSEVVVCSYIVYNNSSLPHPLPKKSVVLPKISDVLHCMSTYKANVKNIKALALKKANVFLNFLF